jgi:hypothetical protein
MRSRQALQGAEAAEHVAQLVHPVLRQSVDLLVGAGDLQQDLALALQRRSVARRIGVVLFPLSASARRA